MFFWPNELIFSEVCAYGNGQIAVNLRLEGPDLVHLVQDKMLGTPSVWSGGVDLGERSLAVSNSPKQTPNADGVEAPDQGAKSVCKQR